MLLRTILLLPLFFWGLLGLSQSGWQLEKQNGDLKVYTKKADSSAIKSIKVEGIFEGSWEKLSSILMNVDQQTQWVYHTKSSHLLKKFSGNELLYYTETSMPWPLSNRDAAVRLKILPDPAPNVHQVLSTLEPNAVPVKSGLVRIPYYKAVWEVKNVGKNKIAITYFLDVQPGGSLPAWVVNMFITTGPFETFTSLAKLLKK